MPDPISSTTPALVQGTQSASFDRVPATETSTTEDTPQDVVEITITEPPPETNAAASTPVTYGPAT